MAPSNNKSLGYSLVCIGFFAWTTVSKSCYYPDGIQATDNTPCSQNASVGICCGPGFTCLSNGLCQQGQYLFRGTCTDSTWRNDDCPSYCKSGRSIRNLSWWISFRSGGTNNHLGQQLDNWVSSCPSLGSGYFCCGSDNLCCKNSTLIFDLGPGTVLSTAVSTPTSVSTTTAITMTEITATKPRQSTSTIASNQTISATSIQSSIHDDNNHGSGANVAIAAGVGVGVGLAGCASIVTFLFFFCRRRRRRRQVASDTAVSEYKSRELPLCELELSAPRTEMASTEICELPTMRG